jgi:hypothetical protein
MATVLGLAMQISANTASLAQSVDEATKRMKKLGDAGQKVSKDLGTLKNLAIGKLAFDGITALASGFVSAGQAAIGWANSVRQSADATGDLAARTGIGVEALQGFQVAAGLTGVENLTGAVQKLSVEIGQAAETGKSEAFTDLGIDFARLQTLSPEDQFREIAAAISALPTAAERAAAAVKIFGKSGVELLPLFNENLAETEARARRLGIVLSEGQVSAIQDMNDALDLTRMTFDGIIGQVTANLAPVVTDIVNEFLSFVEQFEGFNGGEGGGTGIADVITNALFDGADYLAGILDSVFQYFSDFGATMTAVGEVFSFVGKVFYSVGEILRAAFNVFEIAGNLLALAIGKMLEGLGSWISSDLEAFGRDMAAFAEQRAKQNIKEAEQAATNAGQAFSQGAATNQPGFIQSTVREGRAQFDARNSPEEKAKREEAAQKKLIDRLTANFASAEARAEEVFGSTVPDAIKESVRAAGDEADRVLKEVAADGKITEEEQKRVAEAQARYNAELSKGEAAMKQAEKDAEARAKQLEKIAEKEAQIEEERVFQLSKASTTVLKASDVRTAEGASEFLRLATGREDPAIAEYRKQLKELQKMNAELAKIGGAVEIV